MYLYIYAYICISILNMHLKAFCKRQPLYPLRFNYIPYPFLFIFFSSFLFLSLSLSFSPVLFPLFLSICHARALFLSLALSAFFPLSRFQSLPPMGKENPEKQRFIHGNTKKKGDSILGRKKSPVLIWLFGERELGRWGTYCQPVTSSVSRMHSS